MLPSLNADIFGPARFAVRIVPVDGSGLQEPKFFVQRPPFSASRAPTDCPELRIGLPDLGSHWFAANQPLSGSIRCEYAATIAPPTLPLPSRKGWIVSKAQYQFRRSSTVCRNGWRP